MFFLLRMAFWFSLVLLMLPFGKAADRSRNVGPVEAFSAVREAVEDVAGLCERKPDVCATGRDAIHTISIRAGEGGRMALDMLQETPASSTEFSRPKAEVEPLTVEEFLGTN